MGFCLSKCNWGTDFTFDKTDFENSKKLESIVSIFAFFIKFLCQSKESPLFLDNPPPPRPIKFSFVLIYPQSVLTGFDGIS